MEGINQIAVCKQIYEFSCLVLCGHGMKVKGIEEENTAQIMLQSNLLSKFKIQVHRPNSSLWFCM